MYVRRPGDPKKTKATVACLARQCDLALLTVGGPSSGSSGGGDDEAAAADAAAADAFWDGLRALTLVDGTPDLQTNVIVCGYPVGGDSLSITKGIVSRVCMTRYSQAARLASLQIDAVRGGRWGAVIGGIWRAADVVSDLTRCALLRSSRGRPPQKNAPAYTHTLNTTPAQAINPGNSGGPAFADPKRGLVAGVAFSKSVGAGTDNIGFIIPSLVVRHFLDEYDRHGCFRGLVSPGFLSQPLESPAQQRYLGLPPGRAGCVVTKLEPASDAARALRVGDVILEIDGHQVAGDETVAFRDDERLDYSHGALAAGCWLAAGWLVVMGAAPRERRCVLCACCLYTTNQKQETPFKQHNTTQHNTTQHNTTQHNTTQHNTTQHNTTQHNNNTTQQQHNNNTHITTNTTTSPTHTHTHMRRQSSS